MCWAEAWLTVLRTFIYFFLLFNLLFTSNSLVLFIFFMVFSVVLRMSWGSVLKVTTKSKNWCIQLLEMETVMDTLTTSVWWILKRRVKRITHLTTNMKSSSSPLFWSTRANWRLWVGEGTVWHPCASFLPGKHMIYHTTSLVKCCGIDLLVNVYNPITVIAGRLISGVCEASGEPQALRVLCETYRNITGKIDMLLEHQISILEWFLKDHVTLKTV